MKVLLSQVPVKMNSSLPQAALRWIALPVPGTMVFTQFAGGDVTLNKENIDPNGSIDWLHRNSSYEHYKFDNDSISSNTSYFFFTVVASLGIWCLLLDFPRKNMMSFSTNSNFMYIFKQQQYYRFRLCRFVLHPCIGLMYTFIILDSATKSWASVYNHDEKLIMLSHWICNWL